MQKKDRTITLKVTERLRQRLHRQARSWDRSLNWTCTKLLEEGLSRLEATGRRRG